MEGTNQSGDNEQKQLICYPHQSLIISSPKRHLAIIGGVGSGKGFATMTKLMIHLAEFPGTQVIIGRYQKTDVERVPWTDFQRQFPEYIKDKNQQKLRMTLKNGSIIHFLNLWDPERGVQHLDGYNISAFLISQAEQVPEECYHKLIERSRNMQVYHVSGRKITELDHLRLVEGNPAGKDWMYHEFVKPHMSTAVTKTEWVKDVCKEYKVYEGPDSMCVQIGSANFSFVPSNYLQQITRGRSDRHIARYVNGEFDNYQGLVFDGFSEDVHVIEPFKIRPDIKGLRPRRYFRIMGLDWGLRNPTAVLWSIWDSKEDIFYIYREYYVTGKVAPIVAKEVLELTGDEEVDCCFVDPAIYSRDPITGESIGIVLEGVWQSAIPIEKGVNSIDITIAGVTERLQVKGTKAGLYLFEGAAPNLITEFSKYSFADHDENKVWKTNVKEVPIDKYNHSISALRYMTCTPLTLPADPIRAPLEDE